MNLVVPAVLPSSKGDLEEKLTLFESIPSVRRIQIDVVDGRFARPASWPYTAPTELSDMVSNGYMLPRLDCLEYEIDLMCLNAEEAAAAWLALGATRLTFHAEATTNISRLFASVHKQYGAGGFASGLLSFGLAINITSDLALIDPCVKDIEYIQFMGIARIGRQGQQFDKRVLEKIRIFHSRHPQLPMQVDGGVSIASAKHLISLGVSNLVIGSNIIKAKNPTAAFAEFENLKGSYCV